MLVKNAEFAPANLLLCLNTDTESLLKSGLVFLDFGEIHCQTKGDHETRNLVPWHTRPSPFPILRRKYDYGIESP